MHRVDTSTAVGVKPASEAVGDPGYFTKGDPVGGLPATVPGVDWCNMIQEELIAILVAFGVTPDQTKADYGQIIDALMANLANISGNASQVFKAAPGVAANEVVTKGQAASETDTGLVELANAAEILAGTDAERAVTPAGLASLPKLLSNDGYITLPGGLILQWSYCVMSTSPQTFTLPMTFPSAVHVAMVTDYGVGLLVGVTALTLSQITLDTSLGTPGGTIMYFALGY